MTDIQDWFWEHGRHAMAGGQCDVAGHTWTDAGGGLMICALCETERWADQTSERPANAHASAPSNQKAQS